MAKLQGMAGFNSIKGKLKTFVQLWKDAFSENQFDFTTLPIKQGIILLAIPMMLEMVIESLFSIVNIYWIKNSGSIYVAIVGITESLMTIVYSIAFGVGTAGTALIARRIGEGKPEKARKWLPQLIWTGLFMSIPITLIGLTMPATLLRWMGANPEMIEKGMHYTQWILATNVCIMLLHILNGALRGGGQAGLAMRSLWVANIINMILDPIFILGIGSFEGLGLQGAAYANTISRSLGVMYQLWILWGGKSSIHFRGIAWKIHWKKIKQLFTLASGSTGQFIIGSGSWIVLNGIVTHISMEASAGYTIAIRIIIFTILPAWGIAMASATMMGQNLGAKFVDRAEQSTYTCAKYNMIYLCVLGIITFFGAQYFLSWFHAEGDVAKYGILTLRIISLGNIFYALGMVITQSFNGAGDTFTPIYIALIGYWLIEVPLAWFLGIHLHTGVQGVCWSVAISEMLISIYSYYLFKKGSWRNIQLE